MYFVGADGQIYFVGGEGVEQSDSPEPITYDAVSLVGVSSSTDHDDANIINTP